MTLDKRSETNIATLVPNARKQARAFMKAVLLAEINAQIIGGSRTFAQQDALYERGRTKPGSKVTNARGGFSYHNFGIAWDIGIFDGDGKYLTQSADYGKAGAIGRSLGLEWGGDWKGIVDQPHFQCKSSLKIADMRALVLANGGDISDPRAIGAIDALIAPLARDTETEPKKPVVKEEWEPVEVYLNTRKFDITAYFKDSRAWISVDDFTDYFGGVVIQKPKTPTKVTVQLQGEDMALTGEVYKKRLLVKFADINRIFEFPFRFDSVKKRLTLSKPSPPPAKPAAPPTGARRS
ncbi:MAG: M15 family metallopeptidase [Armatimonadota bacterium]